MKKIIGVMGPGKKQASQKDIEDAYKIGKIVAGLDAVLLCGGMSGVMEACAKGAQEAGGLTLGIGPTADKQDMNNYLDIPLLTGMHAGRNYMNVISSDVLVFVSVGSPGTLSELAFAIQVEKPSVVINGSEKLKEYIKEISGTQIIFVDTTNEIKQYLEKMLA